MRRFITLRVPASILGYPSLRTVAAQKFKYLWKVQSSSNPPNTQFESLQNTNQTYTTTIHCKANILSLC